MFYRLLVTISGLLLSSLFIYPAVAQSIETRPKPDSADIPVRALQFSYSYMNPVSYRGRTFGVHQWGMMPQISYKTATNWSVYSVGYIWNDFQISEFGKVDLGIEKEGNLGKHLSYTLGYEHWFFPNADAGERQPLNNFIEASLSGEWHEWSSAIGVYYMVGSEQLLQTDLQLSRYVGLVNRAKWSLFTEPLVKAILANQNYIINGIYQTQVDKRGRLIPTAPDLSRPIGLVAAEVNVPITLQTHRWSLVVDPRVAQPYNTLPGEKSKAFFYAVVTMTYTLPLPKSHGH